MPNDNDPRRALAPVIAALKADRDIEAARKLVEVLAHDTALSKANLAATLSGAIGKTPTLRLIRAFAQYPCVACKHGLEECARCNGKGTFSFDQVCESCLGLRVANCGFCAGSDLITYNFVPAGLRLAVVLERTKLVTHRAKKILATPPPSVEKASFSDASTAAAKQLLSAHRILDALNNAVGETQSIRGASADDRLSARCRAACLSSARRLVQRVRELLRLLHQLYAREAASNPTPSKERALAHRADFYKRLAASPAFRGSGLHLVYLEKAMRGKNRTKSK